MLKKVSKRYFQGNVAPVLLVLLGSISWSMTMFRSGQIYDFGMGFWGPHGHDGVWHIALAQSLANGSWEMPTFSGSQLQNYHVGFDLLLAFIHQLTSISLIQLYFQIIPAIVAVTIGILTYSFVYDWKKSRSYALWATFFVYFGGSWGWIFRGGESMFWAQQSISTLINPPFALSLVFLLLGLISIQKKKLFFAVLCFGLLSQIKAYAFVLGIGGLLVSGILMFIKNKDLFVLRTFIGSIILGSFIFLPLNKTSTSLFVWQPFWFLETMMGLSDRFNWPKYYEAMLNYKSGNSPKVIPAYLGALLIFWFGNLGTRFIKEILPFRWMRNIRTVGFFEIFFASVIVAGIAIPTFFVQAGTPWNTIQFLYYSLFFSSILAGVALVDMFAKRSVAIRLVGYSLFVLLTIPSTIQTVQHYTPDRPPARVSLAELEALSFLKSQSRGVVLTYPFDKIKADEAVAHPPRPLYLYESTAYVAAFSGQSVFLEDQVNLEITQYPWKRRFADIEDFHESLDEGFTKGFLQENKIEYIYWVKPQRARLGDKQLGLKRIFENSEVDIWKVIK